MSYNSSSSSSSDSGSRYGEKYYKLKDFKCPAEGCPKNDVGYDWVCRKDNTQAYISQKGNLRCSSSNQHIGKICQWKWNCGHHGEVEYRAADYEGFTFALSSAVQMMEKAGSQWVAELCEEIGKQFRRA